MTKPVYNQMFKLSLERNLMKSLIKYERLIMNNRHTPTYNQQEIDSRQLSQSQSLSVSNSVNYGGPSMQGMQGGCSAGQPAPSQSQQMAQRGQRSSGQAQQQQQYNNQYQNNNVQQFTNNQTQPMYSQNQSEFYSGQTPYRGSGRGGVPPIMQSHRGGRGRGQRLYQEQPMMQMPPPPMLNNNGYQSDGQVIPVNMVPRENAPIDHIGGHSFYQQPPSFYPMNPGYYPPYYGGQPSYNYAIDFYYQPQRRVQQQSQPEHHHHHNAQMHHRSTRGRGVIRGALPNRNEFNNSQQQFLRGNNSNVEASGPSSAQQAQKTFYRESSEIYQGGNDQQFHDFQSQEVGDQHYPVATYYAQKPKYKLHRRQQIEEDQRKVFGSVSNDNRASGEIVQLMEETIPLTKASRVLRRGRGQRYHNNEQTAGGFEMSNQNEGASNQTQHKIVSRQGGRGLRGSYMHQQNVQTRFQAYYPDQSYQASSEFNMHHHPSQLRNQRDPTYYEIYEVPDSEASQEHYIPEYERYEDPMFNQEEPDSDLSEESYSGRRRGPKIIKFKQKKPCEKVSKGSENDDKNDILDLYTPKNTQNTNRITMLKPYKGFEQPDFYQGPAWKFIRQSTNQNSKQKHYENGDYDKVQYNFPGAENEDKESEGEMKLYPPIEDFSDEDVGIAPSSSSLRAKVTFGNMSDEDRKKGIPQNIQNLMATNINLQEQQKLNVKNKKPAVQTKTYSYDQQSEKSAPQEHLLIQSLPAERKRSPERVPISMEGAEAFFVKDPSEVEGETERPETYFEEYVTDPDLIKSKLSEGVFFKGVLKMNKKLKNRGYVTVPELECDILVNKFNYLNRAQDGDTVLIELLPVKNWLEKTDQSSFQAKITAVNLVTGQQSMGISGLRQSSQPTDKNYTNETPIELRVVDKSQAQMSPSMSEEEDTPESVLNKHKHKKFVKTDEDCEGYNASNSDNNFEVRRKQGNKCPNLKNVDSSQQVAKKGASRLSNSFTEPQKYGKESLNETNQDKDLWENLERAINKDHETSSVEETMTVSQFLDNKEADIEKKQSSLFRKEITGTREERVKQVNDYSVFLRPQGKIVSMVQSPIRVEDQIVQLFEMECSKGKQGQSQAVLFAIPLNEKLNWMIVNKAPAQFKEDKAKERNPSFRYYLARFEEWTTSMKRAQCNIVSHIGEAGNLQAESMRILKINDICTEEYGGDDESLKVFTKNLDPETQEWKIPEQEIKQRLDLRSKRIFTIDPITARDLDDALSIDRISDTIYEIGVHIADVSYFVQQGTDLDREALKRGTSTYLVHKVFPMLPRLLSEKLCSLNPNVDRLTYSVFFRLDLASGQLDESFTPVIKRSVIRACAKWNYQLVEDIILQKVESDTDLIPELKPQGHEFIDCASDVLIMNRVAQSRRKDRMAKGCLDFVSRDFHFTLNPETSYPLTFQESQKMFSKQLVEEFMLLANCIVAQHLVKFCKSKALLRAHSAFKETKKQHLVDFFSKAGYEVNITNTETLSVFIRQVESEPNSIEKVRAVKRKLLSCLQQAKYVQIDGLDEEDYYHWGLNFGIYTHFTSPIRRYADLLVHRLLTISLKEQEGTLDKLHGLDYSEYAQDVSVKAYNSKKASRDCDTLFHCLILKDFGRQVHEAVIFDIQDSQIGLMIHELDFHVFLQLKKDKRIDETTFFEDSMGIVCTFRYPLTLGPSVKVYKGNDQLNISTKLLKRIQTGASIAKDFESTNCYFQLYDKVKVKIETTDTFPLDINLTLLLTQEDHQHFAEIQDEMALKRQQQVQLRPELSKQNQTNVSDQ